MGEVTKIAWCDHTFNPWIGCTRVSPGCQHCYAETQNKLYKWNGGGWGPGAERHVTSDANWAKLRQWDRKAEREGVRRSVFVASLADVFDLEAPADGRYRLFREIECCEHLEFLLLSKRPENWEAMLAADSLWLNHWPAHVRLGFTAEDQTRWDQRYAIAEQFMRTYQISVPFFVSCEPLLGPIEFCPTTGQVPIEIGWVIVGGESGHGARQMQPDWARRLRDQCNDSGVPFFFKQWGDSYLQAYGANCAWHPDGWDPGKGKGGSVLDGHELKEFPK